MTCNFIHYAVPAPGIDGARGAMAARTKCLTHNMDDLQLSTELPGEPMCPIGRIEQATNEAIQKIEDAANRAR